MTHPYISRNRAICIAVKNGMSYREAGRIHGLSGARIEQIVKAARLAAAPRTIQDELTARVRNALDTEGCPITPEAVSRRYTMVELRRVPNIGALCIRQINAWLVKHGQKEIG